MKNDSGQSKEITSSFNALTKLDAFYAEKEKEAADLGFKGKVNDVLVILGYNHPKQYADIFDAIESGWRPRTTDVTEHLEIYRQVHAVMYAAMRVKRLMELKRQSGEIGPGELSEILIEGLSTDYTGRWFDENSVPHGWVSLRKYGDGFIKRVENSCSSGVQVFAVPEPIEECVRSIFEN